MARRWSMAGASTVVVALALGASLAVAASTRGSAPPSRRTVAATTQPSATGTAFGEGSGGTYPCDPSALALAAGMLGVDPGDLYPGERYPTTGTCVFWSTDIAGDFAVVQLDGLDSDPPAWPCAQDQLAQEQRAEVNGMPASVRACTTP